MVHAAAEGTGQVTCPNRRRARTIRMYGKPDSHARFGEDSRLLAYHVGRLASGDLGHSQRHIENMVGQNGELENSAIVDDFY